MRELTRCIAWTLGLGALLLLAAVMTGVGLAQMDGALAWLVFAMYAPFYLLGHTLGTQLSDSVHDPLFLAAAMAAQFMYVLFIVACVRAFARARARR